MIRKKWSINDINLLKINYLTLSTNELSILLNRTNSSIINKMKILGINRMWTKEDDEILKNNYGINNYEDYKKLLPNRTLSSIFNRTNKLKIKCKEKIKNNYKYNVNHHFFNEITNLTCYWAGFIAADGWISSNYNLLGIKLSKKDINHLEKFKSNISSNSPITERITKTNNKDFFYNQITIYSRYIIKDLYNNFNITSKKTFTLNPPNIQNFDHKISYIIGYIDGDGCISKKTNTNELRISIIGNKQIIQWCKNILTDWLNLRKTKLAYSNNMYSINIGNKNSLNFINYTKKLNIPYMKRKWERYEL